MREEDKLIIATLSAIVLFSATAYAVAFFLH